MLTLYYDASCILCTTNAEAVLLKKPSEIKVLSVDEGLADLRQAGISREYAMTFVCVKNHENKQMYAGMSAVRLLFKTCGYRFAWLLYVPIIKQLTEFLYPIIARNRYKFPKWLIRVLYGRLAMESLKHCDNNACYLPPKKR